LRTVRTLGFKEFNARDTVRHFLCQFEELEGPVDVRLEQEDDGAVARRLNKSDVLLREIAKFVCRRRPVVVISLRYD
jgi:hypothetical protein